MREGDIMIYIVEWKASKKKHNIITRITKQPYNHTGMIIEGNEGNFYCDLSPRTILKSDYICREIHSIKEFHEIKREEEQEVDIFRVPNFFTPQQYIKMRQWWVEKMERGEQYSWKELTKMARVPRLMPFYRWYYRTKGKPYKPHWDGPGDVCSTAVVNCIKKQGGFDLFPEYSECVIYPGLCALRLKENKLIL